MCKLSKVHLVAAIAIAVAILGGPPKASAILVGDTSGGPHTLTSISPDATTVAGFTKSWTLGTEQAPISIEYLAANGLWLNALEGSPPLTMGQTIRLHEFLEIADGGPSWINWNQRFVTEGFDFLSGSLLVNDNLVASGIVSLPDSNTIDYSFGALPAGTIVEIIKNMQWNGNVEGGTGSVFQGAPNVIQLEQFPDVQHGSDNVVVPEPATLALIGVGLGLFGARGKLRNRKKLIPA